MEPSLCCGWPSSHIGVGLKAAIRLCFLWRLERRSMAFCHSCSSPSQVETFQVLSAFGLGPELPTRCCFGGTTGVPPSNGRLDPHGLPQTPQWVTPHREMYRSGGSLQELSDRSLQETLPATFQRSPQGRLPPPVSGRASSFRLNYSSGSLWW